MAPVYCAVPGCRKRFDGGLNPEVPLPKDPLRRCKWRLLIRREDHKEPGTVWGSQESSNFRNTQYRGLCHLHFDPDELRDLSPDVGYSGDSDAYPQGAFLVPRYFPSHDIIESLDSKRTMVVKGGLQSRTVYAEGDDPDLDGDTIVFDGHHLPEDLERLEHEVLGRQQTPTTQPKPVRIKILHEDGEDLHEDMDISEDAEPSVDDPLRPRTQEEMEESSRVDTYRDKHNKGFVDIKNPAEFKPRFIIRKCFVESCTEVAPAFTSTPSKASPQREYLFKFFPAANPHLFQSWKRAIGRMGPDGYLLQPKQQSIVCSKHFSPDSLVPDLELEQDERMTYINGRTIGTTAKLEENWANAVTKVSRWYNPSGKLIPKSKVPSLFKLVTKEKIYIGDCLEEGTVSPEDTALIEMVSRSKWAAMCLGQKWLKQINVNPLIHYNEQGQANSRPQPYEDQSETRTMEGVFSSEEDEGENDMLSGIHSSDDEYKPLRQVAKKKKGNVNKKMVSTYAKSFGKRMQKYQEYAQASKLGHKISDVTKPLRPSDLTDYSKTKFGHRITYERKTGMAQKRFLKSNLNPAKKAKLEREGWTFVPPSNPGSVTKTYSAKKVHQVKPLRQSFRAELDTFMGYDEGREGDNVNYVGGSEDQIRQTGGPSVYLTDKNEHVGNLQKLEVERQAQKNVRKLLSYLWCDEASKDLLVITRGGGRIRAHCAILACASDFLGGLLRDASAIEDTPHVVLALPQYDHRLVDHFVQKCYLLSTAPGMPHGSGDLLKSLFQELRIDSARTMPSTVLEGIKTEPTSSASLSLPYTPSIVRPHKRSAPAIRGRGQMLTLMASNDLNLFSTAGLRQSRRKEKLRPRGEFADLGWSDDDGGGGGGGYKSDGSDYFGDKKFENQQKREDPLDQQEDAGFEDDSTPVGQEVQAEEIILPPQPTCVSKCVKCGEEIKITGSDYFNAMVRYGEVPRFACGRCGVQMASESSTADDKENLPNYSKAPLSIDLTPNSLTTTKINQVFRSFESLLSSAGGKGLANKAFESKVKAITQPLDTSSWMFDAAAYATSDLRNATGFNAHRNVSGLANRNRGPTLKELQNYQGKLKVNCVYCGQAIMTTYKAHRDLMARMQGAKHPTSDQDKQASGVKYICKSCHSAGLKIPVTEEEKAKVEKWKAMLRRKRNNERNNEKARKKKEEERRKKGPPPPRQPLPPELCPYCGEKFKAGKAFEYHLNKELGINPFKCTVDGCDHAEFSPGARNRHLANKHGIDSKGNSVTKPAVHQHPCETCGMDLGRFTPTEIERHNEHHTNMNWKHVCTLCFMRFETNQKLGMHLRHTHGKRALMAVTNDYFQCECGEFFKKPCSKFKSLDPAYFKHLKETCSAHPDVTVNLPYQCPECLKRMRTKRALDIHIGQKHTEKCYECNKCDMKYSNQMLYQRHIEQCNGPVEKVLKKSVCEVCQEEFTGKQRFQRFRTHRKYCPPPQEREETVVENVKSTERLSGLSKSTFLVDTGDKPYSCNYVEANGHHCGLRFAHKNSLLRHEVIHTSEAPSCTYCGKKFRDRYDLEKHEKTHGDKFLASLT